MQFGIISEQFDLVAIQVQRPPLCRSLRNQTLEAKNGPGGGLIVSDS